MARQGRALSVAGKFSGVANGTTSRCRCLIATGGLMVQLVLLLTAQVSGLAQSPVCAQALEQEFGAVSSEVCLAEEDMKRAYAAQEDSSERSRRFAAAAERYRKAANLSTKNAVKVA